MASCWCPDTQFINNIKKIKGGRGLEDLVKVKSYKPSGSLLLELIPVSMA